MIAGDIRKELFDVFGFIDQSIVFERMTDALRLLITRSGKEIERVILIQSWQDELGITEPLPLLYMIRAQDLYASSHFDEAQKYESLAVKYYLEAAR